MKSHRTKEIQSDRGVISALRRHGHRAVRRALTAMEFHRVTDLAAKGEVLVRNLRVRPRAERPFRATLQLSH